jgi:hypothetical protein
MSKGGRDSERMRAGAPLFVMSCAAGFLIIAGCAAYFVLKFFI